MRMDGSDGIDRRLGRGRAALAAALTALVLLVPATVADAAKPLKRGSEGPRVAMVQRWLGLTPDRILGLPRSGR